MASLLRQNLLLCLGLLLSWPLKAQLDPRLQTTKTDFLNLYQQAQDLVMKPEIVTVFDFSGSMAAVADHPKSPYPGGEPTTRGMRFERSIPSPGRYNVTASLVAGSITLSNGVLIRPDGTVLTDTLINTNYVNSTPLLPGERTTADKARDVRNWIRSASHVRFTDTAGLGRQIDLPICWTVLDKPGTVPDTTNADVNKRTYRRMYMTYPLRLTIINPSTTSNTEVEVDSAYRVMSQNPSSGLSMFTWVDTEDGTLSTPYKGCELAGMSYNSKYFAGWKEPYVKWIFREAGDAIIPQSTAAGSAGVAFNNGIPGYTRVQAVKDAAMRTWAKYYGKVFWAYRFLKYYKNASPSTSGESESAYMPLNDSRNDITVADFTTTPVLGQSQRAWVLLNDSAGAPRSDNALRRLSYMIAYGSTPLNAAMANTLAQLNDPNNVFNDIETGDDAPIACRNTYVLLFTDGIPNSDASDPSSIKTPYITNGKGASKDGNAIFTANKGLIDSNNASGYYNIINLAALAAHGGDTTNNGMAVPVYPGTTQTYTDGSSTGWLTSQWIPFWIRNRGAGSEKITIDPPRAITTMTIGVSLSGSKNTASSSSTKYRLFAAAACGDPNRKTWDLSDLTEFELLDPTDPTKGKTLKSTYFFDATSPGVLTTSLDAAFFQATLESNTSVTSTPNLPYVGSSLGNQVYLGRFTPPASGGVLWDGDLYMFSTKQVGDKIVILDKTGATATSVNKASAQWATSDALAARPWSLRKLYTRIPGTAALPNPPLSDFSFTGDAFTNATKGLKNFVAKAYSSDADKQVVIQHAAGGDTSTVTAPTAPTANRSNIMGDIINSSPAVLEYQMSDVKPFLGLFPRLRDVDGDRFRVLIVGTNQGWVHCFGEVTKTVDGRVVGDVDELWAFMPTDFLANLEYIANPKNSHRFMADGTPSIYFLDLPTGGRTNGVLDNDGKERATAIFGLRKGGRSYYALDITNPFKPQMKWSLVPDEAAKFPITADEQLGPDMDSATATEIVKNMGFSSCMPMTGRMKYNKIYRDVVFLGGGYSTVDVDHQFPVYPPPDGQNTPLGRSILALDVNSGEILAAIDMKTQNASIGPISEGVVPFEFVLGSGMAQRAYFLDAKGGLWNWGSQKLNNTADDPYKEYRIDSSDLKDWMDSGNQGLRLVFQDDTGKNALYSTLPAPWVVGTFRGAGKDGRPTPAAVGIAMVSGDRNNPVDRNYTTANHPNQHRLTVVYDRQDSKIWGLDTTGIDSSKLADFTGNNVSSSPTDACNDADWKYITPSCDDFYLAPKTGTPKFGYYVNFPVADAKGFVPKGIHSPMVVANALFYSYFNPTKSDPCSGGAGVTESFMIASVDRPIVEDSRPKIAAPSGKKFTWSGVASNYIALGTRGVLQGGVVNNPDATPGEDKSLISLQTILGATHGRFPKARVWRTVQ